MRAPARDARSGDVAGQDVISDDYLQTYGARLAAGRMFDRVHGLDDVAGPFKGAERRGGARRGRHAQRERGAGAGVRRPGPRRRPATDYGRRLLVAQGEAVPIIGVMRDVQFGSPQHPVAPVVYRYDSQPFGSRRRRRRPFRRRQRRGDDGPAAGAVGGARRRRCPFIGKTAEESLSDFYVPDEQRARLFTVGSLLAVGIGCVGLYGLAAFNTARRFREIGIRKTLGASTADVLRLLLGQILRPVLIANLIAWPLAWFAMRNWLPGFDQRIALSPLFFLAASLLALAVAGLTVIAQSLRLARAEPARALRHE